MNESPNFQIMHRGTIDNSDIEIKTMNAIASMLKSRIRNHPYIEEDSNASTTVRITLKRIDSSKDRFRSQGSNISALFGCITLFVFPYYSETEEFFQVELLQKGRILGEHRYRFHRVDYLSWLMIPFHILYGFHSPHWGVVAYEIDYDEALAELHPVVEKDLTSLLCKLESSPPVPENPARPEDGPTRNEDSTDFQSDASDSGSRIEAGTRAAGAKSGR